MTPLTKGTRRVDWKALNFAGTIDWAVDLQAFGADDIDIPADPPPTGAEGCISGDSSDFNADSLCQFSCSYGFCPENTCTCIQTGPVRQLPRVVSTVDFVS